MRRWALLLLLALAPGAGPAFAQASRHLVIFEDAPLGAAARGPGARARLRDFEAGQERRLADLEARLGRAAAPRFRYRAASNGLALELTAEEAEALRALPFVLRVVRDGVLRPDSDRTPAFVGAPVVWEGVAPGGASLGEGVVVGVIDSGANMDHPSFSDAPIDGHVYDNPLGPDTYLGWCDPAHPDHDPAFVCNDKLIGAWDFVDGFGIESDGPEDSDDHGSHVASLAVGNPVDLDGDAIADVSGVAPHAHLVVYDACHTDALTGDDACPISAMLAAVDQAVLDGVDVVNLSISGGFVPWDPVDVDRALLTASMAGVIAVASAGNDGPAPGSVHHLGPWVLATAASTHDRRGVAVSLVDLAGGLAPPAPLEGSSRVGGYGPAPVVHARDFPTGGADAAQCLVPFPPGTFAAGEIVMCDRGEIARVEKCANVAAGGAGGCILGDVPGGDPQGEVADPHAIPAVHVDAREAEVLREWLSAGSGHTGRITEPAPVLDPLAGDVLADFSARGPVVGLDLVKPDLAAPGVDIFAAGLDATFDVPGLIWRVNSGTSMASPHVAGAAALLRALHADWTPAEIRSVLAGTATPGVLREDAVTRADGFDAGAGRLDLDAAARAGLVLPETDAAFLAADPAAGGDPRTLNLPGLVDGACAGSCAWTRRVRSVADAPVLWHAGVKADEGIAVEVAPESFVLDPGASAALAVRARVTDPAQLGVWRFATVALAPAVADRAPFLLRVALLPTDWLPEEVSPLVATVSAKLKLRFDRSGADKLQVKIRNWRPDPPLDPAGLFVELDLGGVRLGGVLDARGRLREGRDRVRMQRKRDGSLTLKARRKQGDFAALLADEGLVSEDNGRPGKPVEVTVEVRADEGSYRQDLPLRYRSKAGRKGSARP